MLKKFINKINNQEYISNLLYENIKNNYPYQIPSGFDIDAYNNQILETQYNKYKEYFDNMYKGIDENIHIDKEQAKAILADEDYSLIIAGAGTGKTTTMVSKVKYLVDIKKIDPSKILVMSFTKKATQELEERIYFDFNINADVTTFHSLGFRYINESNKGTIKNYVVDENEKNRIFYKYFKEKIFKNKTKLKEIIELFDTAIENKNAFSNYFKENYEKYENYEDYFNAYKRHIIKTTPNIEKKINEILEHDINQEKIYTIKGELVKSKNEARIANFLTKNNIKYKYEKIIDEIMEDKKQYRPDFTIKTRQGENIYIEYYGLSDYKDKLNRYQKIREIKDNYHKTNKTKYIALDNGNPEDIIKTLCKELGKYDIEHSKKTDEEIYDMLLSRRPYRQFRNFKNLILNTIDAIKSSSKRKDYEKIINNHIDILTGSEKIQSKKQKEFIIDFFNYYEDKLKRSETKGYDFSDLLYYANLYIEQVGTVNNIKYDYIIIDEYQDISKERYEFTKILAKKNNAKVVAVGDDWQSIYAFTGSKISYIYNFQKYFKGAKLLKITRTYRNSQELINTTGKFIMKNEQQIKKQLISNKNEENPIVITLFDKNQEYQTLKKLILKIHSQNKEHKILILARKNYQINKIFNDKELKDEVGTKIKFLKHEDIDLEGMTIHKSKGLTSDEVIIIGLDQKFPSTGPNEFWIKNLFITKPEQEEIEFAEERRIFYVALTRTKNHVFLLANKNPKKRSKFVDEIYMIKNKKKD